MPAAQYNITIEQGTTVYIPFIWKDSEGTPVDLSGYTARMQVRPTVTADIVYLDCSTENSRIQIDAANGKVALTLGDELTSSFEWRKGRYDLELISPTGKVSRLVEGSVTVSPEVTK